MKLSNQNLLIAAVVLVIVYMWYKDAKTKGKLPKWFSKTTGDTNTDNTTATNTPNTSISSGNASSGTTEILDYSKVLQKGNKGINVQALQQAINVRLAAPYPRIAVDGVFGSETENAIQLILGNGVKKASVNMINAKASQTGNNSFNPFWFIS